MTVESLYGGGPVADALVGGTMVALFAMGVVIAVLLFVALYVYFAWAWYTIAKKLKYKNPWLAWIPFANLAMILKMGRFPWALIFLLVVPVLGWIAVFVLLIIATWRIFDARHYPGWFSLSLVIPKFGGVLYLVALGFVAWKDVSGKSRSSSSRKSVRKSSGKKKRRKK